MASIIAIANAIQSTVNAGGGGPIPPLSYIVAENGVDFIISELGDNLIPE